MTELKDAFLEVLDQYPKALAQPFKGHPLGDLLRDRIPELLYAKCSLNRDRYLVSGSVGKGNWAEIPWVCIFDQDITKSAQNGYYCVYLFRATSDGLYLSLAIGWTQFEKNMAAQMLEKKFTMPPLIAGSFLMKSLESLSVGLLI